MQSGAKTPLKELSFLWNSVIGIFFFLFLLITIILVGIGFSGIKPIVQFVVPIAVGIMILAVTVILRRDIGVTVKFLIYSIYILLFIVCSSGSFNSIFSFFAENQFVRVENLKWQTNLSAFESQASLILDNYSDTDSVVYAAEDIERRLFEEIRDGGFGNRAEDLFTDLDVTLGGNKLRKPSRFMDDSLIVVNIEYQVDAVLESIRSRSQQRISNASNLKDSISTGSLHLIDQLSDNSPSLSYDPIIVLQRASSFFNIKNTELNSLTGRKVELSENDLQVNSLSNIFDTFKLLSDSSKRPNYLIAIIIALVFSFFVEGGVLILSYMLGKEKRNEDLDTIESLSSEVGALQKEIETLKEKITREKQSQLTEKHKDSELIDDLKSEVTRLQGLLDKTLARVDEIAQIKLRIVKNDD